MTHLIISIALGYVLGQILMEVLMVAAGWAGGAVVRALTGMLRQVIQQRKAAVSE